MTEFTWHIPDPSTQPEFYSDLPADRRLAWVVGSVSGGLICLLIVPFTAFTGLFFFPFLLLTVGFAYRVITIARGSATWGMRVVALEFRKMDGQRFDLTMAFLHTLGLTVSFGLPVLQVISIVLMLTTQRRQGLSDHLLGTVALNRRATV